MEETASGAAGDAECVVAERLISCVVDEFSIAVRRVVFGFSEHVTLPTSTAG